MYANPGSRASGRAQHAGDIKRGMGMARGGEGLVSLVMKTALASGMKNSLALVVKNGLSPMMKNALAGVTEGGKFPAAQAAARFSIVHFSFFIFHCSFVWLS